MIIEKNKPNFALFMTTTIIYSVVNLLIAIVLACLLSYYKVGFWNVMLLVALLVWQFAHIGLCCYFYFSDDRMPCAAKVYLYIDIVIFGIVVANRTLTLIISNIIDKCQDSNGDIKACLLLCAGTLAIFWGYGGCNLLMAYCVLRQQKSNDVEYFPVVPVKQSNNI